MKHKMIIVTATRAEYGLLKPLIIKLKRKQEYCVKVVVTGSHLSAEFGLTYQEIEADGIQIDRKIDILLASDSPVAISKTMALALVSFSEYFDQVKPDSVLMLGDRYEMLAVCCAAMNARIPIIHFYGGETTEGAVDEAIRHSITKMSYLHFTSTEVYRKRVIQLGENPKRVFCVGGIGVENIANEKLLSRAKITQYLGIPNSSEYAIITFHPVTLEAGSSKNQIEELLQALDEFSKLHFIVTKANADVDGRNINICCEKYANTHSNVVVVSSLGMIRYLSAVKYASMVIGNSSSGLLEVPSFGIPTINIGDRQKGRIQAQSIINCEPKAKDIIAAIKYAKTNEFRSLAQNASNPYGDGQTSDKVIEILEKGLRREKLKLQKKFYDINFEV